VYLAQGEPVLKAIDALYGHQLRFDRYRLSAAADLAPHRDLLRNVIERLARIRPQAIYPLLHSFDRWGVAPPPLRPRFHLGQVRISLNKAIMAIIKGRA
jgi:hypothetical protein